MSGQEGPGGDKEQDMYSTDISRVIIADRVRERQTEARNARRARLAKALKR
jgi:hypothetical protein